MQREMKSSASWSVMSKTMEEDVEAQQVESSKHLLEKHSGRRGKREDDDFKKGFKGSNRTVREQVLLFWTRLSTRGRFSLGLFTVLMCTLLVLAVRDQHARTPKQVAKKLRRLIRPGRRHVARARRPRQLAANTTAH